MEIINLISRETTKVSQIESFSGMEHFLQKYLKKRLEDFGRDVMCDSKGNLWSFSDSSDGKILLCAHMDKVGFEGEVRVEKDNITGRLDDALGIGVILAILQNGFSPSVLFTVEEESWVEDGLQGWFRNLPNGIHSAGARYASELLWKEQMPIVPKVVVVIDVSDDEKVGSGSFIYKSSLGFCCPRGSLKDVTRIFNREKIGARFIDGGGLDLIEFTFVAPKIGSLGVGIPVSNIHSPLEKAKISDALKAFQMTVSIIKNVKNFTQEIDKPAHIPLRREGVICL